MNIGTAYANKFKHSRLKLDVPDGSTVREAIEISGLLKSGAKGAGERGQMFPILRRMVDLCNEKSGIFGPLQFGFRDRRRPRRLRREAPLDRFGGCHSTKADYQNRHFPNDQESNRHG